MSRLGLPSNTFSILQILFVKNTSNTFLSKSKVIQGDKKQPFFILPYFLCELIVFHETLQFLPSSTCTQMWKISDLYYFPNHSYGALKSFSWKIRVSHQKFCSKHFVRKISLCRKFFASYKKLRYTASVLRCLYFIFLFGDLFFRTIRVPPYGFSVD